VQLPQSLNVRFISFHIDPGRTEIRGADYAAANMVGQAGDKRFMIFWYTEFVGWMICRKESIEKAVESTSAYEPDIADLHGTVQSRRTRIPQRMSAGRILDCKMRAEDVVVVHVLLQE
jgi:hypothetical protein